CAQVGIWRQASLLVKRQFGSLPDESRRYYIIRCIIDVQVKEVVSSSEAAILESGVQSADDVRLQPKPLVRYSPALKRDNLELRAYLYKNLYYNPIVHEPNRRAVQLLEQLFVYFMERPQEIGDVARKRARKDGWPRAVCDYLAGMTDRFAIQQHQRLFGLNV